MKKAAMRQTTAQRPADIKIQSVQQTASGSGAVNGSLSAPAPRSIEARVIAIPLTRLALRTNLLKKLLIHHDKLEGTSGY